VSDTDDEALPRRGALRRGIPVLTRYIRTHPKPFAVAVTGSLVYASTAVAGTVVLGRITDDVFVPAFAGHRDGGKIAWAVAATILIAAARSVGVVTRRYSAAITSRRMQVTLRTGIADRFLAVPLPWLRAKSTGELLANADNDVEVAVEVVNPLPFSLGLISLVVFSVVALFLADPILAVIGLTLFPALALLNRFYTQRVERPAERVQERVGEVSSIAHESYDGALVVKTLGLESREVERLRLAAERLRDARIEVGAMRAFFEPVLDMMPNLGIIAILALGGWRVSQGALSTGQLVQVMALFTLLAFPMRVVGFLLEEMPRSSVALRRIDGVLAAPDAPTPADARPLPPGPLGVEVAHLDFAYLDGEPVLADCTFSIAPGEVVALVGATGSGKSTLCELLTGLIEPDSGEIRLGGVPHDEIEPDARRDAVALVFQESFLFADTLRENLSLGRAPEDDVARATRLAQADRFIARLPEGDATILGERGVTLSGGQRQRAALARALVRQPRLLMLDDATSAVDPTVEARILAGLRAELDTTALIVAHRVSTIALADRVLYLRDGAIAAAGTHEQLLRSHPDYAGMVRAYELAGAAVGALDDDETEDVA
jgi:ABC-type multidrug transport system fused ATPase/permease subunit